MSARHFLCHADEASNARGWTGFWPQDRGAHLFVILTERAPRAAGLASGLRTAAPERRRFRFRIRGAVLVEVLEQGYGFLIGCRDAEPEPASLPRSCPRSLHCGRVAPFGQDDTHACVAPFGQDDKQMREAVRKPILSARVARFAQDDKLDRRRRLESDESQTTSAPVRSRLARSARGFATSPILQSSGSRLRKWSSPR